MDNPNVFGWIASFGLIVILSYALAVPPIRRALNKAQAERSMILQQLERSLALQIEATQHLRNLTASSRDKS